MKKFSAAALIAATLGLVAGAHGHEGEQHGASTPASGHHHEHAASIGEPGDAAKATRTVNVEMTDTMRFSPDTVEVRPGETVRFAVHNAGQLKHEFVLGSDAELKEHYELMKKFPEMEHSDPNQVTVPSGKTGEVVWRFTQAGAVQFACLQPGHYDAGMKGQVHVAPNGRPQSSSVQPHRH